MDDLRGGGGLAQPNNTVTEDDLALIRKLKTLISLCVGGSPLCLFQGGNKNVICLRLVIPPLNILLLF